MYRQELEHRLHCSNTCGSVPITCLNIQFFIKEIINRVDNSCYNLININLK
ncbi:MAG: hypothetical protein ACTSRP_16025 [Candidatus Helarchaeota archaeon]